MTNDSLVQTLTADAGQLRAREQDERVQLAILHRALHRIGFRDETVAGHISMRQDDGTMLLTARGFGWDEMRASNILNVDQTGHVLGTDAVIGGAALMLHTVIHELRPEIRVAVHHHPVWATVWAAAGRIPPIYDQLGSFVTDDLVVSGDYRDDVSHRQEAESSVADMAGATTALLRSHGVLVLAESVRQAYLKCVALEHRSRLAWHVRAFGDVEPMSPEITAKMALGRDTPEGMKYLFEYATRREISEDPSVLD